MKDTWNELLEFESLDLIQQFFKTKYNSEVNLWKVQEIAANFLQAREYFSSAKKASFTVKPVLLYYGVVSLSKGLVLTLTPSSRETSLKNSHGLEIKNWNEILVEKNFEELEITVGQGTFSELLHATQNLNYLRVNQDSINWKVNLTAPPSGYKISFKTLFQYLPDLRKEFRVWTGELLPFGRIAHNGMKQEGDLLTYSIYNYDTNEDIIGLIFPESYCPNRIITKSKETIKVSYTKTNWSPNFTQIWHGPFDLGDLAVVPVIKDDKGFNALCTMFVISYTLGMMARYFPTTWISMGRVQKGDKIFPLINKTLKFIEEIYPQTILDFLRIPYDFEKENKTGS